MYIVVGELGCSTFHQPYALYPTRITRHDFLIVLWTHLRRNAVVIGEWCCLSSRKNRSYIPAHPLSTGDFIRVESLRGKNIERFANITQRAYYQCGTPADPKLAIVHKFDRLIEVGNEV